MNYIPICIPGQLDARVFCVKALPSFLHGVYRLGVRIFLSLRFDFCTWQDGELPPGPKIFVSNHFSSSDAHFVTTLMRDPIHMVIGPGFDVPLLRVYLRWAQQIPANTKETRAKVVQKAVEYLRQGDSIYIFPEGRLNTGRELMEFHKGAARICLDSGCPLIPIGLIAPMRRMRTKSGTFVGHSMKVVSRNYYANIGRPMAFDEEMGIAETDRALAEQMITDRIKDEVSYLIEDIRNDKFWS